MATIPPPEDDRAGGLERIDVDTFAGGLERLGDSAAFRREIERLTLARYSQALWFLTAPCRERLFWRLPRRVRDWFWDDFQRHLDAQRRCP
jgi:hypothetical protein